MRVSLNDSYKSDSDSVHAADIRCSVGGAAVRHRSEKAGVVEDHGASSLTQRGGMVEKGRNSFWNLGTVSSKATGPVYRIAFAVWNAAKSGGSDGADADADVWVLQGHH